MALIQIYEDGKDARLFDGHLTISFSMTGYRFNTGFSKNAITRIVKRFGYERSDKWEITEWGFQAKFKRF